MVMLEQIWGYDDYEVYYSLEDDKKEHCLTSNGKLLKKVIAVIEEYHKDD